MSLSKKHTLHYFLKKDVLRASIKQKYVIKLSFVTSGIILMIYKS